jgi:hypothetical protein
MLTLGRSSAGTSRRSFVVRLRGTRSFTTQSLRGAQLVSGAGLERHSRTLTFNGSGDIGGGRGCNGCVHRQRAHPALPARTGSAMASVRGVCWREYVASEFTARTCGAAGTVRSRLKSRAATPHMLRLGKTIIGGATVRFIAVAARCERHRRGGELRGRSGAVRLWPAGPTPASSGRFAARGSFNPQARRGSRR